jgi:hypothetical protein
MFDIKEQDVMGQTNKLLFNIWQELKSNRVSTPVIPQVTNKKEVKKAPLLGMKRPEILTLVKEKVTLLPPKWTRLSNEELLKLLKDGDK